MEKAWYWKVIFVFILVVASTMYVLPTFFSADLPDWYKRFFNKEINLGLDLQGGIHLVLGVELDKALEDKADQYVHDFRTAMKERRIAYEKVFRVPGTWDIQFRLKNADDKKKLMKRVLDGYDILKEVDSEEKSDRVIRLTFDEKHVKELRRNARDRTEVTVRNRVNEFGVAEPTIAKHGENGILVQLPGVVNPEQAKTLLGRTAQLEFKLVEDNLDFIKGLKNKLPEGIEMHSQIHEGPNNQHVTEYFLTASGKGNEGRERLLDFFNNTAEIEQFMKDRSFPTEVVHKIKLMLKGSIAPLERKKILALAKPILESQATTKPEQAETKENTADKTTSAAEKPAQKKKLALRSPEYMRLEKLLQGKVPTGYEIGFQRIKRKLDVEFRTHLLKSDSGMTGDYITDAFPSNDPDTGAPEVSFSFNRTGANIFEKLTGENVKRRMAIVLEGEVASAPTIQGRIPGGRARITLGSFTNYNEALREANELSVVLRAGALPAPVRILEERSVQATMGVDARNQGTIALIIGLCLVVLFMIVYYRFSGFVADMALVLNGLFILAVMAALQANLTLPGIAGIILTIGMAVDANVIINERIREELHSGKTPRAAVDSGYSRAFWTIFDANFTTMIAAVVLMSYGSGPIKGFAVTLLVGILASMFTAIFVTRLVMDWVVLKRKVERLSI